MTLSQRIDSILRMFNYHGGTPQQSTPAPLLAGNLDTYNGITVDPASLPTDPVVFRDSVRASLSEWKSKGIRGVWLKLMLSNARLIPIAIDEGFIFHHAEPEFVMLTKWLPDTQSTLPENASHVVGVGAIVVKDRKEILVLQERTGPTKDSGVWKMPTGVVHMGEDIKTAVVREVKEETGLETEFVEVLGVRQSHDAAFGKSDLFFLCLLRPITVEIKRDESEISAAQWMSLEDYRNQPFNAKSSMLTKVSDIVNSSLDGKYTGFQPELLSFGFRRTGRYFYHNKKDIDAYLGTTISSTDGTA